MTQLSTAERPAIPRKSIFFLQYIRYVYYTPKTGPKQGENVHKEFLNWGLEIGQIDWYNKLIDNDSEGGDFMKNKKLPAVFAGLAVFDFALRWAVYGLAVDEKNLIISGHPAVIALWVLAAAALALAVFSGRKAEQKVPAASAPAFFGHGLLGAAMAMTALLSASPMAGILGLVWKVLGLAGAPCLLLAGWQRMTGKEPFFGLYAAPSLFFAAHVVAHYQIWCSNPQITDYAFALLACAALAVHCYQRAAVALEEGDCRILKMTALAAVFLCGAEMAQTLHPWLYLAGAVFCLTDLPE
jgi:hypothetical protein